MGISGLLRFVKDATEPIHVKKYAGQTVAVDTYCWIHRGSFACAEKLAKNEHTDQYVKYCMKFIDMLESFHVKPVLVFDGCRLPSKELVEQERHKRRKENMEKGKRFLREGKISAARDCFTKCISVTPAMALRVIEAARSRGVDCVVAPYEADAQLAFLSKTNVVQAIITEDSDLLCFGCKNVIFKMDLTGRAQEVSTDNLGRVKNLVGFTPDLFRHMCILSGCDYLPSVRGVGLVKACKALKLSKSKDSYHVASKLHQYIKGLSPVDANYGKEFARADKTFLYQLVFDPKKRKVQPLNNYPENVDAKDLEFAGPLITNEKAFQIALGNIDINTQLVIGYFDIDNWIINRKAADNLPSVWGEKPVAVKAFSKASTKKKITEKLNGDEKGDVFSSSNVLDVVSIKATDPAKKNVSAPTRLKQTDESKIMEAGDIRKLLKTYQGDKVGRKQKQTPAKVVKSRFFASQTPTNLTNEFTNVADEEVANHSSSLFGSGGKKSGDDSLLNDILQEINDQVEKEIRTKRSLSETSESEPKRSKVLNNSNEALEKFARRKKKKRLTLPMINHPSSNFTKADSPESSRIEFLPPRNSVNLASTNTNDESIPFLDKNCVSQSLFGGLLDRSSEEDQSQFEHSFSDEENLCDENVPVLDLKFDSCESRADSPREPLSVLSDENGIVGTNSPQTFVISSDEENNATKKASPKCQSRRLGLPSRGRFSSPVKLNVSKYFSGSKASGLRRLKPRKSLPNQPSIKSFFHSKT